MKKEESYERVLVFQKSRREFFRKLIRFMDKYILSTASLLDSAPLIAHLIANDTFGAFIKNLKLSSDEIKEPLPDIVALITEYSSVEILRNLRNTVFTTAAPYFRDLVIDPKGM